MMNSKKGFTIVELVIVIAIIAILAAVLIPTFSNIIEKANESSSLQEAKSKFNELYALDYADGVLDAKQNGVSMVDSSFKVVNPLGYDGCIYKPTGGGVEFSYKNGKYECSTKLEMNGSESKWSFVPISNEG